MTHNGSSSLSAISKGVTEEMSEVHKASGYVFTRNSRTPRHVLLLTAQNSGGKSGAQMACLSIATKNCITSKDA